MKSEIFDEFAKLAIKQGLIKEAAEETNPRYSSRTLSDIEILYGIKPNKDDGDMIGKAHPDPVYVAPAYDRMNGLVENQKEQQAISTYIALKPTDGKHIQERYVHAKADLVNELTKIAFMLDKKDEVELMKLADDCGGRLVKVAVAWFWWAIPALIGLIGASSVASNQINSARGFVGDAGDLSAEMEDVIDTYPEVEKDVQEYMTIVQEIKSEAKHVYEITANLSDKFRQIEDHSISGEDLADVLDNNKNKDLIRTLESHRSKCGKLLRLSRFAYDTIEKSPELYENTDWISTDSPYTRMFRPLISMFESVSPNDVKEVLLAIDRLTQDTKNEISATSKTINMINKLMTQGEQIKEEIRKQHEQTPAPEQRPPEIDEPKVTEELPPLATRV